MAGHAHCVFLAIVCIILTIAGLRSAYLFMISLLFYVGALTINLLSSLHDRGKFLIQFPFGSVLLTSRLWPKATSGRLCCVRARQCPFFTSATCFTLFLSFAFQ